MSLQKPTATIVIPHFNGEAILRRCLVSLQASRYPSFRVLVVDNASTDGSMPMLRSEFPEAEIVHSRRNLGYAGGCNLGIRSSKGEYVALLNNDTVVDPDWLGPLVERMESDDSVAAVQPKLLSIRDPHRFDYCGAAGGELDIFGYPFARGRLFQTIEKDEGQYDDPRTVFWASGAAALIRRSALNRIGLLDEAFFAHMEEIDLNWRMQKAGYRIAFEPRSVVYHQTGATLSQESARKILLNQRNNLIMVFKNYQCRSLVRILPVRMVLDLITVLAFPVLGLKRSAAVVAGWAAALFSLPVILRGRARNKACARIPDSEIMRRMYRGSVALAYYLRGIRKASQLHIG